MNLRVMRKKMSKPNQKKIKNQRYFYNFIDFSSNRSLKRLKLVRMKQRNLKAKVYLTKMENLYGNRSLIAAVMNQSV